MTALDASPTSTEEAARLLLDAATYTDEDLIHCPVELAGEPELLAGVMVGGLEHLPIRYALD